MATALLDAGFAPVAVYQRMINEALPIRRTSGSPEYASFADSAQIHQQLFEIFNQHTDHLPTEATLRALIAQRQVVVARRGADVRGCIIFRIHGRRVNYNHLYNLDTQGMNFLVLQSSFYGELFRRNIRAGFLWVHQANAGVIRMHQALGWRFDGLQDHFFLKSPLANAN